MKEGIGIAIESRACNIIIICGTNVRLLTKGNIFILLVTLLVTVFIRCTLCTATAATSNGGPLDPCFECFAISGFAL